MTLLPQAWFWFQGFKNGEVLGEEKEVFGWLGLIWLCRVSVLC